MAIISAEFSKEGERKLRRLTRLGKFRSRSAAIRASVEKALAEIEEEKKKKGEK